MMMSFYISQTNFVTVCFISVIILIIDYDIFIILVRSSEHIKGKGLALIHYILTKWESLYLFIDPFGVSL